jgi:two-component system, OmpR family, response regulator
MCHVTRGSVLRWIQDGKLAASLTAGGHHRVLDSDLVNFLKFLRLPVPPELQKVERELAKQAVLVIDDDVQFCGLMKRFFSKHFPQLQFEVVHSGFEAGMTVTRLRPSIVLLDLMLPGVDGFRVCQVIRETRELAGVRIIAITGHNHPEYKDRVRKLGADDFVTKPLDIEVFKKRVAHYLGVTFAESAKDVRQ